MNYTLNNYSGPLDMLLTLIAKHKLNIFDIQITVLLEQYLAELEKLKEIDYDDAGAFLEMAARLIYIKTVSLLPRKTDESEEAKRKLTQELLEYAECKRLAGVLKEIRVDDIYTRKPLKMHFDMSYPHVHSFGEIEAAYKKIPLRIKKEVRREDFSMVEMPLISVIAKAVYILKRLIRNGETDISQIYNAAETKSDRVAIFLAILELLKIKRIQIDENNVFINIKR